MIKISQIEEATNGKRPRQDRWKTQPQYAQWGKCLKFTITDLHYNQLKQSFSLSFPHSFVSIADFSYWKQIQVNRLNQPLSPGWRCTQMPGGSSQVPWRQPRPQRWAEIWARPVKDNLGILLDLLGERYSIFSGITSCGERRVASGQLCFQMRQACLRCLTTENQQRKKENRHKEKWNLMISFEPLDLTLPEAKHTQF